MQKELSSRVVNRRIDLLGQRFGRLIVLSFAGHDRYQAAMWKVKCDCGEIKILNGNYLRRGHTTSCGCYNLERSIESNSGKNNHQWRGGVSLLDRGSAKYIKWRKTVIERDGHICQTCGKKQYKHLHAHHIYPFSDYKNLRFKVWNGITLCKKCHGSIKNKEYKFIKKFINMTISCKNMEEKTLG